VLHQVAFYTLCSVVFTIMRFPIRVVAIAGVEAEAREGEMAFGMVFSVEFLYDLRRFCSLTFVLSVASGVLFLALLCKLADLQGFTQRA
jgi:hypothetical protein